jgi:glycosyltransferase involved in cell wall biosynthesis
MVAFLLAKWFRKPYVLDFRDPWYVHGSVRVPDGKPAWVLKLETSAKRRAINGAARVICATRGESEELRAEYPAIEPERFTFITNGYDPADFELPRAVADASGRMTMVHAGTIYPGIAGEFFQALRVLFRDHTAIARQLRVQLLGEVADEYADAVDELQKSGLVERLGFLPHREALRITFASDVLLILLGGAKFLPSHLPAKVFEYLYTGKPILAISRPGELTEIVQKSGSGIVVSPDSVDGIIQTLKNLCTNRLNGEIVTSPDRAFIETYQRSVLTERLAAIFDDINRVNAPQVKS